MMRASLRPGYHYRSVIYYHNEEQRQLAELSKKKLQESGIFSKPVVTEILPAAAFYPAEDEHQGYHRKNPEFYCRYRKESGRQDFLEKIWGK
jgi:methionine-S-sulfoxide reductase